MKAIVKTKPGLGHIELQEWPDPSPASDEVKIKVAAAGICGTDIHIIKGEWPCCPPVVLGHEFCGTVVEAGAQVKHLRLGDRVVASNPARTCGVCYYCRAGNPFMCSERVSAGYMIDGAFAEHLCIRADQCHNLPDNVTFQQAALGEPLSVAVHAVMERTTVHAGDLVLVSGPGCIGILVMLVAKLEGARVVVSGIAQDRRRLAIAKNLGADAVVDSSFENLLQVVRSFKAEGADIVFECAGSPASFDASLEAARNEGTLVQVGVFPGPVQANLNKVMMKELQLIGTYGYLWTSWQRCLFFLHEGKFSTKELISNEYPLRSFEEAFCAAQDGSAIKVILNPQLI